LLYLSAYIRKIWRAGHGGAEASEELEAENAKLKRMYADLALENHALKAVLNRKL